MKILVTGSTGLVGGALIPALRREGHTVCRLVRPDTKIREENAGGFDVSWNPETGELGGAAVGAEAVIHLSGASISEGRWTTKRKEMLRSSRVDTTRALVTALGKMSAKPEVLISASAIGYYGNRGDEILTEESAAGDDLLARIAKEWEAEARKAEGFGTRVVPARFGVILAKQDGALPKMMLPFRLGLGGRVGNGKQWMSWITLADVIGILQLCLSSTPITGAVKFSPVSGAVNVVNPQPVTNAEFTQALAKALRRPAFLPAPAFALRLVLGEMADALLLSSQRVVPKKLEEIGYRYQHPDLASALAAIL
ncbi:MAG TPA: TIGR01777 family oxidoreductase [Candidatus Acidoferrum sp.]|nr:TIGR01777 family oxidoreductase [Candidatus Acidoferrum sp.]